MIDVRTIRDFADREEMYAAAAAAVAETLRGADSRPVTLALSGGSSPIRLFELLGQKHYADAIPWDLLDIFWVDERMVPPDHALSNYRLAEERLLHAAPVMAEQVFPMRTHQRGPEAAAAAYERTLRGLFPDRDFPRFDLILLGMGPDGHIASLFPGDPALEETVRWVVPVLTPGMEPAAPRLTLTLPVLNRAGRILALVPGAGKRAAFLDASTNPRSRLPAALLAPQGEITWLTCFHE